MIAIIDYDAGNIKSVEKALNYLGQDVLITRDPDEILASDKVILPGVGAFGDAMDKIKKYQLKNTICDVIDKGTPFLGICVGQQLLFESSEEGNVAGLGILKGQIVRFQETEGYKIPHMGWNSLNVKEGATLFKGLSDHPYVYFVHSYYLKAQNKEQVCATSDYITTIDAAVERDNLFACQFHPEKSGAVGLKILENFVTLGEGK